MLSAALVASFGCIVWFAPGHEKVRFVDGGIAANNPADVAVHEARRLYGNDRPLVVVSALNVP
jgi:patatin-like phospholipase/acyl hydrolase